jgi:hypothetical protein
VQAAFDLLDSGSDPLSAQVTYPFPLLFRVAKRIHETHFALLCV